MLRWAARGVAMGHAPEAVSAAADEVTGNIDDDGARRGPAQPALTAGHPYVPNTSRHPPRVGCCSHHLRSHGAAREAGNSRLVELGAALATSSWAAPSSHRLARPEGRLGHRRRIREPRCLQAPGADAESAPARDPPPARRVGLRPAPPPAVHRGRHRLRRDEGAREGRGEGCRLRLLRLDVLPDRPRWWSVQ